MADAGESGKDAVYRMFVVEGLRLEEIVDKMKDRLKKETVQVYTSMASQKAAKNGVQLLHRKGEQRKRGFCAIEHGKEYSRTHKTIGAKLAQFRFMNGDMSSNTFCRKYNFANPIRLVLMETGQYEFTLSNLLRIAEILGVTLVQLMEAPNLTANPSAGPLPRNAGPQRTQGSR